MKRFKLTAPKNSALRAQMLSQINSLFYNPENEGDFYCFKNIGNMIITNDYNEFLSWSEPEMILSKFLNITKINGDLGKENFPSWIGNQYIMGYDKSSPKQWIKISFSHIGLSAFYSTAGYQYDLIAELDYNYIGEDIENPNAIDYANISEYDISKIPGIGMIKEYETW